jgi:hypothetical protein
VDTVWLDVSMWTGLRGNFHPFMDIACEVPDPPPADPGEWQQWASSSLGAVAQQEGWQAGRYAYRVERRDDGGHAVEVLTRGQWEWRPAVTAS